jgi:cytochrome c biogenesis protein CcmG/thiol:disulfide interchange protein DsbE
MEDQQIGAALDEAAPEKPQKINLTLVIGAALAIVVVVVGVQLCQTERFQPVGKGSVAPGFAFNNLEGNTVSLDDHRGKVVFLNIWATWCEPCREEMPSMERLYQMLKGRPFEILAISVDSNPSPVKPFRDEFKLTFPILLDTRRKITRIYRATGVPETFIIDANGVIALKVIGARNWFRKDNIKLITELIEQAEAAQSAKGANPAPAAESQSAK